ncbi:hypothetical protein [Saccharospirillum salsuginis]|uniref:DUF2846 domain-containing protein n=1 Tax=Saccharospirillum salsuginis TaxID=418750 RepID=A0A918NGJ6_9GAMM|nr:hypothetical protein [Saccharospirillum salsuginis]GGX65441.1 hypothetical protein GCM10007392_36640 [Saccharospirillum salsuginis]
MKISHSLAALVAVALTGCASLPSPSETDGGMLAFPMETKNETSLPFYYVYEYTLYDRDTDAEVDRIQLNPASGVDVRSFGPYPEGDYYLGMQTTRVKESAQVRFSYKPSPREVYIPFSIAEDTITVLNQQMWVFNESMGAREFRTSNELRDLSSETKEEALASLAKDDESGSWDIRIEE